MTDHYQEAENLLSRAADFDLAEAAHMAAVAQVHATLALVDSNRAREDRQS